MVDGLNQKVEKLRNSHDEKAKVVAMLEEQMRQIAEKQEEKEDELNKVADRIGYCVACCVASCHA